jgi:cytochrome d ubiquinol oxidase subunit II
MFDFGNFIDLPLIFACIIGFAIFVYVILDGFDLGVGILFPFAPSDNCRDKMIMSIAPFWDGNETWLILGGGGLLVAFPKVYSIAMPGFYMPIIIMLLALIFRGVSFEFRFKAKGNLITFWNYCFHFGSMIAAFAQGLILGGFIEGVHIKGNAFAGVTFNWMTPFSLFCGLAVIFSYTLLGSTWLVMKTHAKTQEWALKVSKYVGIYVLLFCGAVCTFSPLINNYIYHRWFGGDHIFMIIWLPIAVATAFYFLFKYLINYKEKNNYKPFLLSIIIFTLCSLGLAFSIWPYIIPYSLTIWEGAGTTRSLSFLLIGVSVIIPLMLFYISYTYYVFRGKTDLSEY